MGNGSWLADLLNGISDLVRAAAGTGEIDATSKPGSNEAAGEMSPMDQREAAAAARVDSLLAGEPAPPDPDRKRTGVVWVHGIGTQKPGESLFDWTRPLLEVLAEWRRDHDEQSGAVIFGENPVSGASVSDPDNRWIAVDIPAYGQRPQPAEWLFTEAYWASDIRPPSFSASVAYLLRNMVWIIRGIAGGYGQREPSRKARLQGFRRTIGDDPRKRELDLAFQWRWRITDFLDWIWSIWPVRVVLTVVATTLAATALIVYAALHAIPIPAVKRRVEIAAVDTFIVEWFADLAVILDDQSQAAAVRTRLLERVAWLKRNGCEDVVLLAHSGGTIVSYATLLRFAHDELPVTKLVTLGEAIKLGWRLEQNVGDWKPGNSIRGDLHRGHPKLRWVDVWASYDPAPSGPMHGETDSPLAIVPKLGATPRPDVVEVESRPVTNFMFLGDDHGGYWLNDEGFLIPVIRHVDDAPGNGDASRFFGDDLDRTLRIERRRRRVALLLAWRWAAFGAAVAALIALAASSVTDAASTGNQVAEVFSFVPGHELVSGTIDGIGNVVAILLSAVGLAGFVEWATSIGPTLLGCLVPVLSIVAVFALGIRSWTAHDSIERKAIRSERMKPAGLRSAHSEAAVVVGGLIAVVVAAGFGSTGVSIGSVEVPYVVVVLVGTLVVSFILRFVLGNPGGGAAGARVAAMTTGPGGF